MANHRTEVVVVSSAIRPSVGAPDFYLSENNEVSTAFHQGNVPPRYFRSVFGLPSMELLWRNGDGPVLSAGPRLGRQQANLFDGGDDDLSTDAYEVIQNADLFDGDNARALGPHSGDLDHEMTGVTMSDAETVVEPAPAFTRLHLDSYGPILIETRGKSPAPSDVEAVESLGSTLVSTPGGVSVPHEMASPDQAEEAHPIVSSASCVTLFARVVPGIPTQRSDRRELVWARSRHGCPTARE